MLLAPGGVAAPRPVASPQGRWSLGAAAQLAGIGVLLAATWAAPSAVAGHAGAVLAAGLAAGGVHGAFDHLAAGWADGSGRPAGWRRSAAYAATAAGALLALLATGPTALWALIGLSVAHFATGEAAVLAHRAGRPVDGLDRAAGWATATAMVLVPLLAHPAASGRIAAAVLGRHLPVPGAAGRSAVVAATAAGALAVAARCWHRRRTLGAVEVLAVLAAGLLATPAAAFAVTFALGHSLRHLLRLADLRDSVAPGARRRPGPGSAAAAAWPLAVAATVAAAAVATGAARWQTALLGGLLALTVPHAAVVAALDRADPGAPRPALSPRRQASPTGRPR